MTSRHHDFTETFANGATWFATAVRVALAWAAAAVAVALVHTLLDRRFPLSAAALEIGLILLVSFCYMRMTPGANVHDALGVGIVWLVLGILAEVSSAAALHHGWFLVLGSPDKPLLRNLFLFVWIFAPALFARQQQDDSEVNH